MKNHCVGLDISKDSFTACICSSEDLKHSFSEVRSFKNDKPGFNQLTKWVAKVNHSTSISFLMEATGVYHETLAHHLFKIKKTVHVILPNKSKHYFKSLNIKTKTDKLDAQILARFGVERKHKEWSPANPIFKQIKEITRYYLQLKEQRTSMKNIQHNKREAFEVDKFIIQTNKKIIKSLSDQMEKCLQRLGEIIATDSELEERINKVCTIKGVAQLTALTIIAETNGFENFENMKQVASFAGYDIVHNESGSSIKSKTRISKKGNKYIRQALYMPAMTTARYNQEFKNFYMRIVSNRPSKMIGQVAVQRKLLLLIYTLWKNETEYNPEYSKKKIAQHKRQAMQDSSNVVLP